LWDLIVVGGGSSGVAAAVAAARNKCKTLLIEKTGFLGGTSTASLVTPMMRNILDNSENLTSGLYSEVLARLKQTGNAAVHPDGNPGWFNPEMMKCILDDICEENNIDLLFDTVITGVDIQDDEIISLTGYNKSGFNYFKEKYFIDASGDADIAALAGIPFYLGDNESLFHHNSELLADAHHQAMSLRFNMANIDLNAFGSWLMQIDPDSDISSYYHTEDGQILLSTAHTWEEKDWKLRPYFEKAIQDKVIKHEDAAYFQVFSIAGQKNALAFNCPRIFSEKPLNPLNAWDLSYAQKMGRKQIRRIAEFCKKYLVGFQEAYISQIAPQLGIRDSRRIKGVYKLSEEDIFNAKKFTNAVAKSNYPVDVHSYSKGRSELKFLPKDTYYEIPFESLITEKIKNLLVVGRSISSTFRVQASLRIQPNCWSMGEAAGKFVSEKIYENIKP